MQMNRRAFFKLTAGAAIASALPLPGATAPIIYGDGVHDDTEALQALLDGKVVEFADPAMADGAGWHGAKLRFPEGIFAISDTLRVDVPEYDGAVVISGWGSQILLRRLGVAALFVNGTGPSQPLVHISGFHIVVEISETYCDRDAVWCETA